MTPSVDTIDFHGVRIPVESLLASSIIVGASGSGKSRCILRTVTRQLLALHAADSREKAGALILDPKNELLGFVREALQRCGREKDLICVGPNSNDATWNPLGDPRLTAPQIVRMILSASTVVSQESRMGRSGDRFWEQQDRSMLRCLVMLVRNAEPEMLVKSPLSFKKLQDCRAMLTQPEKEIMQWAQRMAKKIGPDEAMPLLEFAALPNSTRACVVSSVGSLLDPFCRSPLKEVLEPDAKRKELDLSQIIENGKVVVVNTTHAENSLELLPAQILLAAEWARLVLARSRTARNQTRLVWTIIDEAARVITSYGDPASDIMDMSRASRVGVILALQNLAALHALGNPNSVHRLTSLAANHFFLSNTDPITAAVASASLGSRREYQLHRTASPELPPPLLFPDRELATAVAPKGVLVPVNLPVLDPGKLARLKVGEIYYRLANGDIGSVQADPAAP